jgi:hypothetical protein
MKVIIISNILTTIRIMSTVVASCSILLIDMFNPMLSKPKGYIVLHINHINTYQIYKYISRFRITLEYINPKMFQQTTLRVMHLHSIVKEFVLIIIRLISFNISKLAYELKILILYKYTNGKHLHVIFPCV